MGLADGARWRRIILRSTPVHRLIAPLVILDPHLSQHFCRRNVMKPLRRCGSTKAASRLAPSRPIRSRKSLPLSFPSRRARVFTARTIALHPVLLTMSTQPLWSDKSETVEGSTHRFPDTQESVEGANLGQHMGRISA